MMRNVDDINPGGMARGAKCSLESDAFAEQLTSTWIGGTMAAYQVDEIVTAWGALPLFTTIGHFQSSNTSMTALKFVANDNVTRYINMYRYIRLKKVQLEYTLTTNPTTVTVTATTPTAIPVMRWIPHFYESLLNSTFVPSTQLAPTFWNGYTMKRHVFNPDTPICRVTMYPKAAQPLYQTVLGTTYAHRAIASPWHSTSDGTDMPEMRGLLILWEQGLSPQQQMTIRAKCFWEFKTPK